MNDFSCPQSMKHFVKKIFDGEYDVPVNPERPVVLDIGANIGAFSKWALSRWPGAQITSYEPHPLVIKLLEINLSGLSKIEPCAVWDKDGMAKLYTGKHNSGENSLVGTEETEDDGEMVRTIDAATLPPCDIMKVDTEGAECVILDRYKHFDSLQALCFEYHSIPDRDHLNQLCKGHGLSLFKDDLWFRNRGVMRWIRVP